MPGVVRTDNFVLAAVFKFKNFGNTPAFITRVAGNVEIVNNPDDLPEIPMYRKPIVSYSDPIYGPQQESNYIKITRNTPHSDTEWGALINAEKFMVTYGIVEYSDPFKNPHYSRFCYVYDFKRDTPIFRLCGPEIYNKHT
jgi:hypothetical protein